VDLSKNLPRARRASSQPLRTTFIITLPTWQTVSSGFFFRQPFSDACKEQVADRRQDQVTFQAGVTPSLVLIEADLALLVLEASLDAPARESYEQQGVDAGLGIGVTDEEFDRLGLEYVACDDQVQALTWKAIFSSDRDESVSVFPNRGAFLGVLDVQASPGLGAHLFVLEQLVDALRARASRN